MPLELACTTEWRCGETFSIYTKKLSMSMADLAKTWTTELLSCIVWE